MVIEICQWEIMVYVNVLRQNHRCEATAHLLREWSLLL